MILVSWILIGVLANGKEEVEETLGSDGPWNYLGVTGFAGTVTMNAITGSSLFYWLFEAIDGNITSDSLPLMIWLEGGPGCSGSVGMIWENISPLHLSSTGQPTRTPLDLTWGTNFHIMSIDFPYGTGYSFANSAGDNKNTTESATYYLWRFLNKLSSKYPTWFKRPVYIFGESYGGHWVPGLAYNILMQNSLNPSGFVIDLQGVGMGDPWVDPISQTQTYSTFTVSNTLVNEYQQSIVNLYQNTVNTQLRSGQLSQACATWDTLIPIITSFAGGVNVYNIREFQDYDFGLVDSFMNLQSTKTMLNVPSSAQWLDCNMTVYAYYQGDIMNSTLPLINYILSQNVSVIIYQGQDDLIVPTTSTQAMIPKISWSGAAGFAGAPKVNWMVDGVLAGYAQSYSYLTFVSILKSGHLTDLDQPYNVKDLVLRFTNGTGWN